MYQPGDPIDQARAELPVEKGLLSEFPGSSPVDLARLLAVYRPYLKTIAEDTICGMLAPRVDGSDLVQETLLRAAREMEQFRGSTEPEFAAWLKSILQNAVIDAVRHHQSQKRDLRREQVLGESVSSAGKSPSGTLQNEEELARVTRGMQQLTAEQRQVLIWRSEGCTFKDIGQRLQRTPDAARMLWGRAVKRLLRILERDGRK